MIDFLVIGGGVGGLSAAARLSDIGSVVLLEQEAALGYHASGRSAALFEENYGQPATIQLNKQSHAFHRDAGVLKPRGLMLVGRSDAADLFAHDVKTMHLTEITGAQALEKIPLLNATVVDRAAFDPDAWDIDTDLLLRSFERLARSQGAQIITKAPVSKIERSQTGWAVTIPNDRLTARHIVNAAGAWADQVAQLAGVAPLGLTPCRRSMARLAAPKGQDITSWPMLFGPGESWYAKPDAGALIISPAEEDIMDPHDAYADDMRLAEGLDRFAGYVDMPLTRPISTWAGLRTFAPDRNLVIGPDTDVPSFIWFAGQGGYGMQSSPGASQMLLDLLSGAPCTFDPATVAALSPARLT